MGKAKPFKINPNLYFIWWIIVLKYQDTRTKVTEWKPYCLWQDDFDDKHKNQIRPENLSILKKDKNF